MSAFLQEWLANTGFMITIMGLFGGAMFALEILFPKGQVTFPVLLRSVGFWCVALPVSALVMTAVNAVLIAWRPPHLLTIPTGAHSSIAPVRLVGGLVGPILAVVISDFFDYWMHRAQHRFFWRYHSLHHSIREVSALSGVNHWSEPLFRTALITVPTVLIGVEQAATPLVVVAYVWGHGFFVHSACRLHLGPLRRLIVDNRFHRLHHSTDPAHFDKNFATGFTFWDQLFGTAVFPQAEDWPETGLADTAPPESITEYVGWTFARRSPAAQVGDASR